MKKLLEFYAKKPFWTLNKGRNFKAVLNENETEKLRIKLKTKLKQNELIKAENELKKDIVPVQKVVQNDEIEQENKFFLSSYLYWPTKRPNFDYYLPKLKTKTAEKVEKPVLITKTILSSRSEIDEKTIRLVNNLRSKHTFTDSTYIRRLQEFCSHLKDYPEARGVALKHEALGQILAIQNECPDSLATKLQANEALALLGEIII